MIKPIGHFRIHRELYHKPIWKQSTPEQKVVLMTLIAMAWFKPNEWEWKGEKFKTEPGQFVTSLQSIADDCGKGITIQNVRSSLIRFEKLEFLTNVSTKEGRLITIANWGLYQYTEQEPTKVSTKTQQRVNKDPTTKEECIKEIREENNIIRLVVEHLNTVTGKAYKFNSAKTVSCILARVNEGFNDIEDYKKVIDSKYKQWNGTKDEIYIRPETLFGTKFEGYLQTAPKEQSNSNWRDGLTQVERKI